MRDEDMGAVVLLEMAERDVLPVAGKIGESQHVRADRLQKSRRAAAVLYIRSAVGAGGGKEEGIDDRQELAQVVGELRLPPAGLEHPPRPPTRLLRLHRR